jgi:hypothetical protein
MLQAMTDENIQTYLQSSAQFEIFLPICVFLSFINLSSDWNKLIP